MSLGINIIFLLNKNAQDKLIIELLLSLYERHVPMTTLSNHYSRLNEVALENYSDATI